MDICKEHGRNAGDGDIVFDGDECPACVEIAKLEKRIEELEWKDVDLRNKIDSREYDLKLKIAELEKEIIDMRMTSDDKKSCALYKDFEKSCQALKDRNEELKKGAG